MQANYYLDIRIMDSADDGELTLAHLRNQIYSIVHGVFRDIPHTFALALEISAKQKEKMRKKELKYNHSVLAQYDVLRIFAAEQQSLEQLIERIKGHWKVRDYTILNHPIAVPAAKVTGFRSYFRFRIPTLKTERNAADKAESRNARRIQEAKKMPYFRVSSQSTGQSFTVNVRIEDVAEAQAGLPDGYGLARQSQPFSLPIFEVN